MPPDGILATRQLYIGHLKTTELVPELGVATAVAVEIEELHRRANSLVLRANLVLAMVVGILSLASLFIVFANKIAELGIVRIDPFVEIVQEHNDTREKLGNSQNNLLHVDRRIADITLQQNELAKEINSSEDGASVDSMRTLERLSRDAMSMKAQSRSLSTQIGILSKRLEYLDKEKSTARASLLAHDANNDPGNDPVITDRLIATSVTRFGVLIVAIYLVQILIDLYRYNTRTAAYYQAHADCLLFSGRDPEELAKLHKVLRPDVNYGKLPKNPSVSNDLKSLLRGIGAQLSEWVCPRN